MAHSVLSLSAAVVDGHVQCNRAGILEDQCQRNGCPIFQGLGQAHQHYVVTTAHQHVLAAGWDFEAFLDRAHAHDSVVVDMCMQLDQLRDRAFGGQKAIGILAGIAYGHKHRAGRCAQTRAAGIRVFDRNVGCKKRRGRKDKSKCQYAGHWGTFLSTPWNVCMKMNDYHSKTARILTRGVLKLHLAPCLSWPYEADDF